MKIEEIFFYLEDKYGDEFNWGIIPPTNKTFVEELKKEIGREHFLYNQQIYAVAKSYSTDDVLYLVSNNDGKDYYYIFHLTYSNNNLHGFPKYKRFEDIQAVKEYIEQIFITEYM